MDGYNENVRAVADAVRAGFEALKAAQATEVIGLKIGG